MCAAVTLTDPPNVKLAPPEAVGPGNATVAATAAGDGAEAAADDDDDDDTVAVETVDDDEAVGCLPV